MNTPVSFELAKLLKEKGFDKRTPLVWLFSLGKTHLREVHLSLELNDCEYNAPTIAETVMWLYEKYGIWISVGVVPFEKYYMFEYAISKLDGHIHQDGVFDTPTEAYKAGIEYSLKNLI